MKRATFMRWLPIGLNIAATMAIVIFGLIPFSRKARVGSKTTKTMSAQLDAKVQLLAQLPAKQSELDSLVASLSEFRSNLLRTDQVHEVTAAFNTRATAAGLDLWILNPSLPALIEFDAEQDSVANLGLAVLPISFECHGDFLSVGKFIEAEEARAEFCVWQKFVISVDPPRRGVRATGDVYFFLLPEANFKESS